MPIGLLSETGGNKEEEDTSGVARTSPLLGHSMGTLRLYELPHEGGQGHPFPPKI